MATNDTALGLASFKQFIKDSPIKEFRPLAYYDKHLDCIRVQIKDCSFEEERVNRFFTLWHANHSSAEYVGFAIKGVKHLFVTLGLPKSGPVYLAQILDAILKHYSDQTINKIIREIKERFKNILELPVDDLTDPVAA